MLFNSIFGRKNSTSSTASASKGVKLNKNNHQARRMMLEPLESRDLLTVTTGPIDDDAYDEIRAAYPDFELPELQANLNVMTITPDDGALSLADLKSAIATAGTTTLPDLILIQTSDSANSVTYASAEDEVTINLDSTQYGSVTILAWGEEKFTLNANQQSRVMTIDGESAIVNLGGLTIQNGIADNGGGLYSGAVVAIANCNFSGNTATFNGGGIYNDGSSSTLTITNSTISDNEALGNSKSRGGGLYNNYGTTTITNCTIFGNAVYYDGGGICNNNGTTTITNSTISDNTAISGGAIHNHGSDSTLTITNCTISANSSSINGGGIYNWYGSLTLTDSEISGNTASASGGGIYNDYGTTAITNSTIFANKSYYNGGGMYNNYGSPSITNSTIFANTASGNGGGMYNRSETFTITNCTITANNASSGGGIYRSSGSINVSNSIISLNYANQALNNVQGELASNTNNIIDSNPGFVCEPEFDSNYNLINADTIDLHLRSDSIAIDNGDNTAVENIETDIDGSARIYGETVDIGAYEYQGVPYSTVVDTLNDSFDLDDNEWSLREAIYYSTEYVTITFADDLEGTIVLSLGQLEIDKALAIDGDNRITIDADQKSRVFFVSGGSEETPVVLNGLTIQNGKVSGYGGGIYTNSGVLQITNCEISGNMASSYGGGIYSSGSNSMLTVTNSEISGNSASNGGGILNGGSLTVINSEISGNTVKSNGGGIYNGAALTITNSEISDNTASTYGGGIYSSGSNSMLTVTNSEISGNSVSSYGGGIYNVGTLTVTNSEISDNNARYGGGVYSADSNSMLTVTNSEISGNTASYSGGGIYNYYGTLTVTNSEISGNTASNSGGGIYSSGSNSILMVTNSEISGNTTKSNGGGIYQNSGTLTITNSTIVGNCATDSSEPSSVGGIYQNSGTLNVYNSIVSLNYGVNIYGELSNNSANNIIDYFPRFVCTPVFNSDGKLTNADTMDLHLRSDSIAINMGNNSAVENYNKDIEGNARIYGEIVDIGAYEYQGDRNDEPIPYSTVVNTLNDSFDLYDDEWSLREAIYYAPEYDTITFADELEGSIILTLGQLNIEAPLAIDGDNRIAIDADQQSRVFYVSAGTEDAPVLLDGLTIQNGQATNGGGIYQKYGTLTITNSTISGNTASGKNKYSSGGGIYQNSGTTLTIRNSTISDNTASGSDYSYGGGIYQNSGTTLTITNSNISDNTGGGIYNSGTLTISSSKISDNTGGGINNGGPLAITNCTISGNTGGGINNGGPLTITNCTISGNSASNGGGIYNSNTITITNCTIFGNTASSFGGGIYSSGSNSMLTVTNSEISGNTASDGGGIYNNYGTFMIINCTIVGNSATGSSEHTIGGIYHNSGSLIIYNSIVSMNYGANVYGELSDNSVNNLIGGYYPGFVSAPIFNADVKLTNADELDLHLRSDSIAIDKGDNTAVADTETDFDGFVRIYGEIVDIGAYEYQGDRNDEPIPYSTVVNTLNDSFDLDDDEWSLREAIYFAPEYVNITFADDLEGTIVLSLGQLEIDKALAINGDNRITIDAEQKSRVFYVSAGTEDAPVLLEGLAIQNGQATNGGGIYNDSGTLTIANCTISGNTATSYGGGIYNYYGTLTITNSTISGNKASKSNFCSIGGGICNYYGTLTITNSTISGNKATEESNYSSFGGGIYNYYGTLTITNSTISDNTASYGGGIYNDYGTLTIANSTISGNTATSSGGGIYNYSGMVTVTNSTISSNKASGYNPYHYYSYGGGGIYNYSGTLTITNSTLSGNKVYYYGGGIYNDYGIVNFYNSIIVVNTANNGNDIYGNDGSINGYNNLSSYTAWNGSDNIEYDPNIPLFVNSEYGNYRILPGSQAYEQGNNAYAGNAGLTYDSYDLAGNRRYSGGTIDIGAYECYVHSTPIEPKKVVSGSLSVKNQYIDYYIFSLDSGAIISFSLLQGDWEKLDIKLFGNGYSDYLTPDLGEITLLEGGTYYLSVSSKNDEENQEYVFRINLHDPKELPIGTTYQGVIPASRYAKIFKVETNETKILELLLDSESANARNEIYVKYNSVPTRTDFDWSSATGAPDQSLFIDNAPAGDYYVLVYSDYCPSRSAYTLRANLTSIKLGDFAQTGVGDDTLEFSITGGGFDDTVQVYAVNTQTGAATEAQSVSLCANGQIAAVFNKNLPAGDYTLRLVKGEDVAESVKTFTYSGTYVSGLTVDLTTKIIMPSSLGRHYLSTIYVECTNNSAFTVAAPLLKVHFENDYNERQAILTLDPSLVAKLGTGYWTNIMPAGFSSELYMIANGETVGILQPGETVRIPVYWAGWLQPWNFSNAHFTGKVEVIAQDHTSEVNWEHELFGILDEYERAENAVYLERLQNALGNTWGEYVVKLSQAATEIYRDYGVEVRNAEELKAYLIDKAHAESMEIVASQMMQAADAITDPPTITKVDLSRNNNGQLKIYVRWDNLASSQIKQYKLQIVDANGDFDTGNTLSVNVLYRKESEGTAEYKGVDTDNILRTRLNYKIRVRAEYKDGTFSEWSEVETYNLQDSSVQGLVYIYKNGQWVPAVSTNSETGDTTILTNSSKKTYVLIHGMNNSIGSTWLKRMAEKLYALDSNANILAVNWGEWAEGIVEDDAFNNAKRIPKVAKRLAFQLLGTGTRTIDGDEFYALGLNASNMYIIGHSHGAHVAGLTGEYAKSEYRTTVKKITALDPSENSSHLLNIKNLWGTGWGTSSAQFVDVYKSSDLYGGESTWGNDNFLLVEQGKIWSKEYVGIDSRGSSITHAFAVDWFITTITTSANTTSPGFWWNASSWDAVLTQTKFSQLNKNDWNGLIVADRSGHWRFEALTTALNGNYVLNYDETTGQRWHYPGNWDDPFSIWTKLNLTDNEIVKSLDNTYELQYEYDLLGEEFVTAGNKSVLYITVTDYSGITSTKNHAYNQIKSKAVSAFKGELFIEDGSGTPTTLQVPIEYANKDLYLNSQNGVIRLLETPTASELYAAFGEKGISTKMVDGEQHICYNLKLKIKPVTPKDFTELYAANDEGVIDITIDTGYPYCSAGSIPSQRIKKDEIAKCLLKAVGGKETLNEKPTAMGASTGQDSSQTAVQSLSNKSYEVINEGIYHYRWVNLTTGETVIDFDSGVPIYEVPDVTVNLGIGTYEFELTVWDRYNFSATDKTSVCILEDPYYAGEHGATDDGQPKDPNEIIGPSGHDGWILGEETLAYQINFENDETATAPAQRVDVEMYLDEDLDWTTFQFTGFGWADNFESLGNGSYAINKRIETEVIPLGEDDPVTIYVEVNAGIDLLSGRVYATFQTLQYTTLDGALEEAELLAPMSANIGFLLPSVMEDGEKVDSRGDGFLTYIVKAKEPLESNTEITAVADIQFDFGEIIATNQIDPHDASLGTDPAKEVPLKIDADAPVVQFDETTSVSSGVLLRWSGSDVGSGISQYQIYVSSDGSTYTLWNTFDPDVTSAFYESTQGEYSFYILAVDTAGNVGGDPDQATPPLVIVSDMDTRIVKKRSEHDSTNVISENLATITDWDDFYMEFWTADVNEFASSETYTAIIRYDSTLFVVDANQTIVTPEGITAEIVDMGSIAGVGLSTVKVTFTVSENGYTASGANMYWGAVHFTPNLAENSGVQNVLEPTALNVTANGKESGTTVKAMPFDLDHNNTVDVNDFIAFATAFGKSPNSLDPTDANYAQTYLSDFDGNGVIDVNDFIAFATNYGISKGNSANHYKTPDVIAQPAVVVVNQDALIEGNDSSSLPIQSVIALQTPEIAEAVVTVLEPSPEYLPLVQSAQAESVQTLRQVHSSALLDLYDNQNEQLQPNDELSASAIDEAIFQRDEFDFLLDESDSAADDNSNSDVDLSVVLDELELELI